MTNDTIDIFKRQRISICLSSFDVIINENFEYVVSSGILLLSYAKIKPRVWSVVQVGAKK